MSKLTLKDLKAQGFELSKEDATELLPKVSQASQHGISEVYAEPKGKAVDAKPGKGAKGKAGAAADNNEADGAGGDGDNGNDDADNTDEPEA